MQIKPLQVLAEAFPLLVITQQGCPHPIAFQMGLLIALHTTVGISLQVKEIMGSIIKFRARIGE